MDNYVIINTHPLDMLYRQANDLLNLGYIPAGGITQVPYKSSFSTSQKNTVRYADTTSNMDIQLLQSFYKPKTNSI